MEKQKIDFKNIALYVNPQTIETSSHSGSHFGVWQVGFVDISKGTDSLQYWDRYSYTGRRFRHLKFRAQWERDDKKRGVYGYRLSLHVDDTFEYSEDAQALVDVLKRVEKARQSLLIQPTTFGQYVTLMCDALGVKRFVYPTEPREEKRWSSLDNFYHVNAKVDELLGLMLDRKIDDTYFPEDRQKKDGE
jgi:hypothetical protein